MKLDPQISLEQFCDEMQHRVVKHPLTSAIVREALTFARKQKDPDYYRIAISKVNAQKQFHREVYGPSRWEKVVDFVAVGSLREVVVVLILVVIGIYGVETVKHSFARTPLPEKYERMSVDEMANAFGMALDEEAAPQTTASDTEGPRFGAIAKSGESSSESLPSPPRQMTFHLSDSDVNRIADALVHKIEGPQLPAVTNHMPVTSTVPQQAPHHKADCEWTSLR